MSARHDRQPVNSDATASRLQLSRRQAMQWVMASMAAAGMSRGKFGQAFAQTAPLAQTPPPPKGYGLDVNLVKVHHPGEFWPLTFSAAQRQTATALADVILPRDQYGPAASEVGVVDMVDEWISAPYPEQQADRPAVLDGLAWLESEFAKRFGKSFDALAREQKHAICDDICFVENAKAQFRKPAEFFSRFRALCAAAYYATEPGWKAIGYVGNVPLPSFDGPPAEVLRRLGVTQTVS